MTLVEYPPSTSFVGTVGRTHDQSSPAWPAPRRAKSGAPNVLYIILDDTGFGHLGCYGSPIRTPNLDRLAANGLRYANMHTTALCSPSRSCMLTGRNHHSNGMACITEGSTGYPGYNAVIPFENGFLSEILLERGYNTYAVGKWHLTPAEQNSAAGPYDRWPLGRGFERYYGFLGGDTHQYYPELVYDNHQVEPPRTPEEGYHLTEDLVDHAIGFVADAKQIAPEKPFFMFFCTGAMHAPHHVPAEWADRYKGAFDDGWDVYRERVHAQQLTMGLIPPGTGLSRHDPDVADWATLGEDERRLYARMMEVFAGYLEHTDHHIGRLLEFLTQIGELDDTLIMVLSDNGASSEGGPVGSLNETAFFNNVVETLEDNLAAIDDVGGPKFFNHYPWGWAWAGNTPFRRWKRETYRGGVSDPFIVHWPTRISTTGEVRTQFVHAIDMVPTVLDCLDVEPPRQIRGVAQSPLEGLSFAATFDDAGAPALHRTQYFEMLGHRAIYHDGWRAVCPVPGPSFAEAGMPFGAMSLTEDVLRDLDAHHWELYHVAEDPTENHDLASENRPKLQEMIALWYVEAGRYNVLPIDSRGTERLNEPRPQISPSRTRYVYYPGTQTVGSFAAVAVLNRPHSITADVEIPVDGAEGVLIAHGGNDGGYALYVQDGRLHYVHNYLALEQFHVETRETIPPGNAQLTFEFQPTGAPDFRTGRGTPGRAQLYINGVLSGQADLPVTVPILIALGGGVTVGRDTGSTVTPDYPSPFAFTGLVRQVVIDVSGDLIEDDEATMRTVLARQ